MARSSMALLVTTSKMGIVTVIEGGEDNLGDLLSSHQMSTKIQSSIL